ncbi:MAG: exo-beta-N-acetylmuramidase NamZ family protein [Candidatus Zhuqueibacterota bacterium]
MAVRKIILACFLLAVMFSCAKTGATKLGIDVLLDRQLDLIKGKNIGVVTNQTGLNGRGESIVDVLHRTPGVKLVALFGPEHGLRGNVEGGDSIANQMDDATGIPIFSIYGDTQKPTPAMLAGIDALIFDIQDVGARFYTYISTMSLCMEAAAEQGIDFIVLDRPNPITGAVVEGPVLEMEFASFVGKHAIALRHGMTVGELAKMFNEEGWLAQGVRAKLTVVRMENWKRAQWFGELGLNWTKPSPNMPSPETALVYPGTCLLEACNVSEGRGTGKPFEMVGAPWLDHVALAQTLTAANLPGVKIDTTSFAPVDIPGMAMNPKYKGERCRGLFLTVTDPLQFRSAEFGIRLIREIKQLHPMTFAWRSENSASRLFGTMSAPRAIDRGDSADDIIRALQPGVQQFNSIRQKYLLYD